jgi:hypothetical protein
MTRELISAAETEEPTRGSLDDALTNDVETRLLAALDAMDRLVGEVRLAEAGQPLEPELVDRIAAAAARADAPFETRWLGARVDAGDLTWAEVWLAPETFAGGMWLWQQVVSQPVVVCSDRPDEEGLR